MPSLPHPAPAVHSDPYAEGLDFDFAVEPSPRDTLDVDATFGLFPDHYPDEAPELPLGADYDPFEGDFVPYDPAECAAFIAGEERKRGIVPFERWISDQADAVRALDSDAATWLAGKLDEIAATAAWLKATTPEEFEGRLEVMLDEIENGARDRAHDDLMMAGTMGY